ncbi:MAG: DUF502 domain-containing protein [Campylobacterota bacterium]|nr:DUF502 domain-containing protein [Campylobacterota bacterium]
MKHFMELILKGLFWVLPIAAIAMIILWLYGKIDILVSKLFTLVGFVPQNYEFLWLLFGIGLLLAILYMVGHLVETRLANFFQSNICKIPGCSTIKDIIGIFNSSKEGDNQVLVVAIKGFATQGYNIGLMYSQEESIIKDHYTVTLSMTPIPNGGYLFEVHKDSIYVIEEATFDDNLQYLLSMGVKSMASILQTAPKEIESLIQLESWLDKNKI